jgi:hypothetical protein
MEKFTSFGGTCIPTVSLSSAHILLAMMFICCGSMLLRILFAVLKTRCIHHGWQIYIYNPKESSRSFSDLVLYGRIYRTRQPSFCAEQWVFFYNSTNITTMVPRNCSGTLSERYQVRFGRRSRLSAQDNINILTFSAETEVNPHQLYRDPKFGPLS